MTPAYAFGVDIGGTAIKLGLFRADGTLLKKWQIPPRAQDKGAHILLDVLAAVQGCMDKSDLGWDDVEGTGMGGGLVVNEQIVNGSHGGAGEIGHFCVEPDETERCSCGGHGCLEQYCSATGLLRLAKKALVENPDTVSVMKNTAGLTAKDVCDAAKAGDALALELLDRLGRRLGWALTAVEGTTDPEVFVIGGGLSNAGEILLGKIEFYYRKYAFHAFRCTHLALAELGNGYLGLRSATEEQYRGETRFYDKKYL